MPLVVFFAVFAAKHYKWLILNHWVHTISDPHQYSNTYPHKKRLPYTSQKLVELANCFVILVLSAQNVPTHMKLSFGKLHFRYQEAVVLNLFVGI